MLVDEQYAYVLSITCISIEGLLDCGSLGFGINDKEVLLGIGRLGYVLKAKIKAATRILEQHF